MTRALVTVNGGLRHLADALPSNWPEPRQQIR